VQAGANVQADATVQADVNGQVEPVRLVPGNEPADDASSGGDQEWEKPMK